MAIIQCKVDRSDWYEVYIEYSVSQNAIKAQSTITHALKIKQLTNGYDFESNFPITYQIGSETFTHSGYVDMNDEGDTGYTITLASGKTVIQHNTTTGVGSFYVACGGLADAGGWGPGNVTLEGRYESLTTIDRVAPNITLSISSVTASSVIISATSHAIADIWDYSLDNGSTWTRMSTTVGKSATKTITGLSPNTTYNIKVQARRQYNEVYGTSAANTITTLGNTLLNSVNALTIDNANPVLTMNWTVFVASYTHKLEIKDGYTSVLTITDLTCSTGTNNKTIALTAEQRTTILQYMSHTPSFTATFELTSYDGTTQIGDISTKTATIQTTYENSAPTFKDFTHRDYNRDKTVEITGNNQIYIKGCSSMYIDIGKDEDGNPNAVANNEATISHYRVTVGSYVVEFTQNASEFGSIGVAGDNVALKVEVIDSRGYSTEITKNITVIDYKPISITSYSIRRKNEVESKAQLAFSGELSPIVVDGEARNKVVNAEIRVTQNGNLIVSWISKMSLLKQPTSRSFEFYESGLSHPVGYINFDPELQYLVEVRVTDRLRSDTVALTLNKGTPLMAFRSKKIGINEPNPTAALHIRGEGELLKLNDMSFQEFILETFYPVGSIYMSVNGTDPGVLFGGAWEQIEDRFLLAASSKYAAESVGGEAEHTLSVEELPAHNHNLPSVNNGTTGTIRGTLFNYTNTAGTGEAYQLMYLGNTGNGVAHNNMPPYLAVYMWKRIN